METKEFKAESKRLLDLMINSIYTHKEIFLREIISNASDAIDKLYYISLTDPQVGLNRDDFNIIITLDKENRTLTVSDNGIGMNAEELENNLGVIAGSGSLKFREEMGEETEAELIGQFGVGFYSAFMVADHITVITKKYGETGAWKWESEGVDGYTVDACERDTVGTDIIMHIREDEDEKDEFSRYIREYPIYKLVKKYSDYIRFPIKMLMPHPKLKEGSTKENPEYEEIMEYETLNSMRPIWQRSRSEVTREEYDEFFKEQYSADSAPMSVITASVEGNVTFKALLYIPSKVPGRYDTEDFRPGLQLYSAGVKIMDSCAELLPDYFNFVRGVVDSPDLSLNISREMLQHDRQLKTIEAALEKKIRAELERMLKNDRGSYEQFYKNFGRRLKVCAMENYGAKKEQLQDLLLFFSSQKKALITLAEYVEEMKEDQKVIYFASGEKAESIEKLPQTEMLREKKIDILCFTDKADEMILDMFKDYKGKPFRSATDGEAESDDTEAAKAIAGKYADAFDFVKKTLGDRVDEVRASVKLKTHPVCLSSGKGMSFEMEKYFKSVRPDMPVKAKRILELNVNHAAFKKLDMVRVIEPDRARKYVEILYNQACLIAGLPIEDPSGYTDLICSLFR